MICAYCKKPLRIETSWLSLFQFTTICEHCEIIVNEEPVYERVPLVNGYIDLCQLFPQTRPELEILPLFYSKYRKPLMEVVKNPSRYQIVLFFDEAERYYFHAFAPYLLPFKTILLITESRESLFEIMME